MESKKIHSGALTIILLILLDILLVNLAAFLALYIRHELSWSLLKSTPYMAAIKAVAVPGSLVSIFSFSLFRIYSSMWEFAGQREIADIGFASLVSSLLYWAMTYMFGYSMPRSFPVLFALIIFLLLLGSRFILRALLCRRSGTTVREMRLRRDMKRTMIVGAGYSGAMVIKEFSESLNSENNVVCIIDDDRNKHGMRVRGVKVVGGREVIEDAIKKYRIEEIVFCIPSAPAHVRNELLELCSGTGVKLKTLPALAQLANGEVSISQMRDVRIDDLLGRPQVHTDNSVMAGLVRGSTVLVTGGGGSIGSELCRQIASFSPGRLVIFDIYENNAYDIQQELKRSFPGLELVVLIGSVRDEDRVNYVFDTYRPKIVCHAAAHKHVPLMEDSPAEAIKNNVFGTYKVADAAGKFGTELFILISSDKAVNPTNVMGASKRVCEMIVQSMNGVYDTRFIAVRFGNVMGSNGSVIPLFRKQIAQGGPVTVTDKRVTRYFMTIPEAVSLILQAGAFAAGGEVFVLDMGSPVRIDDMARKMIRLSGFKPDVDIKIEYTGLRPGEKLFEELLLQAEGMEKTDNDLIYIGHQTMYSLDEIHRKLETLAGVIHSPRDEVRRCILDVISEPEDVNYVRVATNDCEYCE